MNKTPDAKSRSKENHVENAHAGGAQTRINPPSGNESRRPSFEGAAHPQKTKMPTKTRSAKIGFLSSALAINYFLSIKSRITTLATANPKAAGK